MVIRAETKQDRPFMTVKTLGSHTYAIPQVAKKRLSAIQAMIPTASVVLFPITASVLFVWTGVMFFAPKFIRHAVIAKFIPIVMKEMSNRTENQRKLLLQHVSGRVLDVGSGGGAYMQHLKGKATHVVALEPVSKMHPIIRAEAKKAGFQDYQVTILTDTIEEYIASNPSASFDWVILGNVLCEVESVESTVKSVNKVLKPSGKVYFSEHCGAPKKTYMRALQNTINPWWKRVAGGCNCNRDSLQAIEGMAEWDVVNWDMENLYPKPFVMGLAQKVQADAV